jgi:hypothetical protein
MPRCAARCRHTCADEVAEAGGAGRAGRVGRRAGWAGLRGRGRAGEEELGAARSRARSRAEDRNDRRRRDRCQRDDRDRRDGDGGAWGPPRVHAPAPTMAAVVEYGAPRPLGGRQILETRYDLRASTCFLFVSL